MAKRLKVALIYTYNENWIGGTYYIQNLIQSLKKISEDEKPALYIICEDKESYNNLKELTNYPFMTNVSAYKKLNLFQRVINKVSNKILNTRLINTRFSDFDLLFPASPDENKIRGRKYLYWIPDFQEHYLKDFFSDEEIESRIRLQRKIVKEGRYILFSSKDAQNDFNKFYRDSTLKQFVLPFAVTHPPLSHKETLPQILKRFDLPAEYFICCNQFWIHKNHRIVLMAISVLKKRQIDIHVAFSGKQYDYRFPDYFRDLEKYCIELNIEDNVHFLGFIDRGDQLMLIKHSQAVLQPSLFEGWSTVVEDGKSLNANIIASNLNVHKEQLELYPQKLIFDPHDENDLARCLTTKIEHHEFEYNVLIQEYGRNFLNIISSICNQ